jgi:hypothetical protein
MKTVNLILNNLIRFKMKKVLFTFLLLAATCFITNATVRTVSNDAAGGAQYGSLQAAYDASSNTDTLLVEGTDAVYGSNVTGQWAKNLVVIGIGFNPLKQNPRRAKFSHFINCCNPNRFTFLSGASGSKFYGIEFTFALLNHEFISNITFEDCKFNQDCSFTNLGTSGIIFKNCIFSSGSGIIFSPSGSHSNILISNCIFDGIVNTYAIHGDSNPFLVLTVDHCLFLCDNSVPFRNLKNALIKNCIFMNNATIEEGTSSANTYLNNLSRLGGFPSGSGNIANTNPNFVTYTPGTYYSSSHNYNLQSGSAAIGTGSDGTDIGVNGGFTNFNESGEVLVAPIVRSVNILNTTVAPNGTLNIQISASKPNDQ